MLTGVEWKNLDVTAIPQNETTDKYTATIVDQSEDNVTLSIENVAESVGDSTELDVVLTDKNGITKRSEVGKTFTGGE